MLYLITHYDELLYCSVYIFRSGYKALECDSIYYLLVGANSIMCHINIELYTKKISTNNFFSYNIISPEK